MFKTRKFVKQEPENIKIDIKKNGYPQDVTASGRSAEAIIIISHRFLGASITHQTKPSVTVGRLQSAKTKYLSQK